MNAPRQVELTAKKWKALQLLGGAVALIGSIGWAAAFSRPGRPAAPDDLLLNLLGGIVLAGVGAFLYGRVAAWWYHR